MDTAGTAVPDTSIVGRFELANGFPLGNVVQSCAQDQTGRLWIVVNNSNKVEVCDPKTLKRVGQISGLISPRYVAFAAGKAFISDLYSNSVTILDEVTLEKLGAIRLKGWSEQLLVLQQKVYVSVRNLSASSPASGKEGIYVIDPVAGLIVDSVLVGAGAQELFLLDEQRLVTSVERETVSGRPAIQIINGSTMQVERQLLLGPPQGGVLTTPIRLTLSADGKYVFYFYNGLKALYLADMTEVELLPYGPNYTSLTSIGVTQGAYRLWVGDAGSYTEPGRILEYRWRPNQQVRLTKLVGKTNPIPGYVRVY